MDEIVKNSAEDERDFYFSRAIKAGKRIYYIDVKKSRRDEFFLAITESKKMIVGSGESARVNFEKHKIFLYREDFEQFSQAFQEALDFIKNEQGDAAPRSSMS